MNQSYVIPAHFIKILSWTLIAEIILIVILLFAIIFVKVWKGKQLKNQDLEKRRVVYGIMEYMKGKIPVENVLEYSKRMTKKLLVKELEIFNQRFIGEEWELAKFQIAEKYLLPFARRQYTSRKWLKRAYAARIFAIAPLYEDREAILKLFADSNFQVQSLVIPAIVQLKIKEGVVKILEYMSKGFGYARYFYLDTLVSAKAPEIFHWISSIAENSKDHNLHLACLEVLSGKMQHIPGTFVLRDVYSQNEEIRLAALKIFARNPQKDSLEILLQFTDDPVVEMRKESYAGLVHFRSPLTLQVLEKGLSDPDWNVRVQAATSLKNMGKAGLDILNKQSQALDSNAYEAAHFILQLDW